MQIRFQPLDSETVRALGGGPDAHGQPAERVRAARACPAATAWISCRTAEMLVCAHCPFPAPQP